jgi:acyl dehydratase
MPVTYDQLMSRHADDWTSSYTDNQVLLYNLSVGMGREGREPELPYVFEQPALQCVPTFAALLAQAGGSRAIAGVGLNVAKILHGEERLTLYRPLPPSAELVSSSWVSEVLDKGPDKGALITVSSEGRLAQSGEALYRCDHLIFARGDGGCGGPTKSDFTPHVTPDRAPDIVHVAQTRPDEALLYRLNGDRNPLHAHPDAARRGGFAAPILHGMCSYGMACRAVLAAVCDYDVARIKAFDARFTSPVYPGETVHTDIWVDGEVVSFRSRVEARGVTSLNNGRCLIGA